MEPIQIQMLGEFSLRTGDRSFSDTGSRSKKAWSLLAYLICNRGCSFSSRALTDLLWGSDPSVSNPENALRITLHRLRSLLDQLWDGAGQELILRREDGYGWNPSVPVVLDCELFEQLCLNTALPADDRLRCVLEALDLYRGEFLSKHSSEMWIIPLSTHFQNRYLLVSMEAARLLSALGRHREAARICRAAVEAEPYHEPLHQLLIRELAADGDHKAATAVYDNLSRVLFDAFGIHPSEETRAIYRTAVFGPEERELPISTVLEDLQEPADRDGAMECDYDYFKVLCHAHARAMEREGNETHIALLSLSGSADKPLSKRSLTCAMDSLSSILRSNLRRGDVISRCSLCQYIIMLPGANYENSCTVCRRLIRAFHSSHPRMAVSIRHLVQPLSPRINVP